MFRKGKPLCCKYFLLAPQLVKTHLFKGPRGQMMVQVFCNIYIYICVCVRARARTLFRLSPNNVVHVQGLSFFSLIDTHLNVFSSIKGLEYSATHIIFFTINLYISLQALMQAPYFLVNGWHANTNHFLNNTSVSFSTNEYFSPTCQWCSLTISPMTMSNYDRWCTPTISSINQHSPFSS
jgi:hypothetical protein